MNIAGTFDRNMDRTVNISISMANSFEITLLSCLSEIRNSFKILGIVLYLRT